MEDVLNHRLSREEIDEEKIKVENKIIELQRLKENFEIDLRDLCNTFAKNLGYYRESG